MPTQAPEIDVAFDHDVVADGDIAPRGNQQVPVLRPVGRREIGGIVHLVKFDRRQAVADQVGIGERQRDVHRPGIAFMAHIGEKAVEARRRGVAPAGLAVALEGRERAPWPLLAAGAQGRAQAAEGAERLRGLGPLETRPVVGAQDQRSAERVEAERRVRIAEFEPLDRHFREQVRLHHVAERVVDADAVEERGDAHALAEQRPRHETAIGKVLLIRVVLHVGSRRARESRIEKVVDRSPSFRFEFAGCGDLNIVGNPVDRRPGAAQRRHADDLDIGQRGGRRLSGAVLRRRRRRQRRRDAGRRKPRRRPARSMFPYHDILPGKRMKAGACINPEGFRQIRFPEFRRPKETAGDNG